MAKPRVFLSSTFYDLRYARVSLETFIRDMGYDSVLNERGNIPYETEKDLEDYCYDEIAKVHIVVAIVGGRFGTTSVHSSERSISNLELDNALKLDKQIYIFIESSVYAEYQTYTKNRERDVSYTHVDDIRVFKFLDEIHKLTKNNQITTFTEIPQIISYLKEQWAGLFERYLGSKAQERLSNAAASLDGTAKTLSRLVDVFAQQNATTSVFNAANDGVVKSLVLQNHPVFDHMKRLLNISYRIFFTDKSEMEAWLKSARTGIKDTSEPYYESHYDYVVRSGKGSAILSVSKSLFDQNGKLVPMLSSEWEEAMLELTILGSSNEDSS